MTEKELLKLAAKAAGMTGMWFASTAPDSPMFFNQPNNLSVYGVWNPLTDDGDALRLAVRLNLQVTPGTYDANEVTVYAPARAEFSERVRYQQDIYATTRRAIVRAAAEIGKTIAEKSA